MAYLPHIVARNITTAAIALLSATIVAKVGAIIS